jgi:hypothetical protein
MFYLKNLELGKVLFGSKEVSKGFELHSNMFQPFDPVSRDLKPGEVRTRSTHISTIPYYKFK